MKHIILSCLLLLTASMCYAARWVPHFAYNNISQLVVASDKVYALSDGHVFSVDKRTGSMHFYTNEDGLTGSSVSLMTYDSVQNALLLFYDNGMLDVLTHSGLYTVKDLYLKQMTAAKSVAAATREGDLLYLSMPYGVQTYSLSRHEFVDTYYIGDEAAEVSVSDIALSASHIYAATEHDIYVASLDSNLVDYRYWSKMPRPEGTIHGIAIHGTNLLVLSGETIYRWSGSSWLPYVQEPASSLLLSNGHVLAILKTGGLRDLTLSTTTSVSHRVVAAGYDAAYGDYWLADNALGLIHSSPVGELTYSANGPKVNLPYKMSYCGNRLYIVQGGRWALKYMREPYVMMYDGTSWYNTDLSYPYPSLRYEVLDLVDAVGDPADPDHYYAASYGTGILEMQGDRVVSHFLPDNSTLRDASGSRPDIYTFTDCLYMDEQSTLWAMNGHFGLCARLASGTWLQFNLQDESGTPTNLYTPCRLLRDKTRPYRLWTSTCRVGAGIGVLDYQGTTSQAADDRSIFRREFTFPDGSAFAPEILYDMDQDLDGNIWLATIKGLYYYPASQDIYSSNTLYQPAVMPGDADYLLKDEVVNCIRVDSLNRKWIGTQNLGVYVLSADNDSLVYHFTTTNSAMPSNSVLSIAHHPSRMVTMVGTGGGLVEYDEDAVSALADKEVWEDMQTDDYSGMMNGWTYHFAYGQTDELATLGSKVYALAGGSLYYVDSEDEEVRPLNRLTGLSGSKIGHICEGAGKIVVAYVDGTIDLIDRRENVETLTDLKQKPLSGVSKLMNDAVCYGGKLWMATDFGVLQLNIAKAEFGDWMNPLPDANPQLTKIEIIGDSVYAASASVLYTGALKDNLLDYNYWKSQPLSDRPDLFGASHFLKQVSLGGCTYKAANGIVRNCNGQESRFQVNGPAVNMPYRVTCGEDKTVVVPGGRWDVYYKRDAHVMILEDGVWKNVSPAYMRSKSPYGVCRDLTAAAFDPADPNHFYVSSYSNGLYEMRGTEVVAAYHEGNSPIRSAVPNDPIYEFVDGVTTDAEGNVWILNGYNNTCLLVKSPTGQWGKLSLRNGGATQSLNTPGDILIDKRRPNYKWIVSARMPGGIGLIDDAGTPFVSSDDRSVFRTSLVDDKGKLLSMNNIYAITQDRDGNIWLGTDEGPRVIAAASDFFQSNRGIRPVVRRTDGSNLGDYILGTERINSMAVDGGNRIWFGTESSGVYLMKINLYDTEDVHTIYHFTTMNSPLPSNRILSIAIRPSDGEVFFGTDGGLVSFRSDATEPEDDYRSAYVYPNPVRPNYTGVLTVTELMEDSEVRITDAAGALVYTGTANGGTLIWDLRDASGRRVRPGVYLVMCNSKAGAEPSGHTILKVLVM